MRNIHFPLLVTLILSSYFYTDVARADFSPFQTRDQNPYNLIHGQPLPVNAQIAKPDQPLWNTGFTVTNTLNIESTSSNSIYLDYESYQINASLQYALNRHWSLKMDLPVIYKGGGFLDSAINNWHEFFNLPQADRPNVANDLYQIKRVDNNMTVNDIQSSATRIGDIQLALANEFYKRPDTTISAWAGLKLPTGNSEQLTGNDAVDASLWLAANQRLSERWFFNGNAGLVFPAVIITGTRTANNTSLNNQVLFGHMMLAWRTTPWLDLKIQLNGHTSYYKNNDLRLLGSTYTGTFGGSFHLNECHSLDISFSEDIKVSASPDASFTANWRYQPDCSKS